jgi:hypothetical protein
MSLETFRETCAAEAVQLLRANDTQRTASLTTQLAAVRRALEVASTTLGEVSTGGVCDSDSVDGIVDRLTAAAAHQVAAQVDGVAARAAHVTAALSTELEAVCARERTARTELEATRAREEAANTELDAMRAREEAARAEVGRLTQLADEHTAAHLAMERALTRATTQLDIVNASQDRLQATFERLAGASSVAEVLSAGVAGLAGECSRVALFLVQDEQLTCVQHSGFDAADALPTVMIPLAMESVFSEALNGNRIQVLTMAGGVELTRVPFRGDPEHVLVLPIVVGGRPLALLYADDDSEPAAERAPMAQVMMVADLLRRHAVARLEALAGDPQVLEDLHAYVTLLLDEVEYRYTAHAGAQSPEAALRDLEENLEAARNIYAQRIEGGPAAAVRLMDVALQERMAARAATPFGRDLTRVAAANAVNRRAAGLQNSAGIR